MGLIDSIKASSVLALDTNILIAGFNQPVSSCGKLLETIQNTGPKVFISTIVFEEFLVQIYKRKLGKDIAYYEDFITGQGIFSIVNVDREIARKAAQIRAQSNLKAPDAIHIASAIESKAKIFLTTDRRLPRKINGLKIEVLS